MHSSPAGTERPATATTTRPAWLGRARDIVGSTWFLAALVTLVSWPARYHSVAPGLDPSAITGLHMAAVLGLDSGREVIFTYGPLGFLAFRNAIFDGTALWSALYIVAVRYTLCCSLIWAARRNFPLLIAVPLAIVGAVVVIDEELIGIAFIWSVIALGPGAPIGSERLAVHGSAIVAGLALLIKPSLGINALVLTLITVAVLPGSRRRHLLRFLATFAVVVITLLLASSQSLLAFPDYISTSIEMASGYQTAFVLGDPSAGVLLLAGLMISGALLWAFYATGAVPTLQRAALIAVVAYFCYAGFKTGFTRFNYFDGHLGRFAAAMMLPWFAFRVKGRVPAAVAAAAILAIGAIWFPWTSHPVDSRLNLRANVDGAVTDIRGLVDTGRRHRTQAQSRDTLRALYRLDPRALRMLSGQRVDADPWEASVIWAYGLEWSPAPVFQTIAANTPKLDRINADWLRDPSGPTRIIRPVVSPEVTTRQPTAQHLESVDRRYAAYDAPTQTLAMLCNYAPLDTTPWFQILGRTADRCGETQDLTTVSARLGEDVQVPAPPGPDQVVLAEVDGITPSGLELVRTSLYRALRRYITFDGAIRYQLTPLNAGEPLLLHAPPKVDLPLPYALAPNARSIAFSRESGFPSPPETVEITFTTMKVEPAPQGSVRGFSGTSGRE